MFTKILLISTFALCAYGQLEEAHPAPEPYSFTFESPNEDGSTSARSESGDAEGRITGFYMIKGLDGQDRRVDYVADKDGFRAEVSTNELGTETHEAASAIYRSSSPPLAQLIAEWESSGAAQAAAARRKEVSTTRVRTNTILTDTRPVVKPIVNTARVTETVRTQKTQVTPEGYVLVPASAARNAGIASIGPEISNVQGFNRGGATQRTGSIRTITTETKPITTTTRTRFLSGVTGGLTGSVFAEGN